MDQPVITFDEAAHSYTLDGKPVPGVSSIIELAYDFRFVDAAAMERARDLGSKVHLTIDLYERGRLKEATLHEVLRKHLDQYKKFKDDFGYVSAGTEVRVGSRRHQYCGTLDNHGFLMPTADTPEIELILDEKTGDDYAPHKLQTAGYKLAAVEMGLVKADAQRASLYLSEDEYCLRWHRGRVDELTFVSLRNFHYWSTHHAR